MFGSPVVLDVYVQHRLTELFNEAERERLAAKVTPRGPSLRQRAARSLYALAARVEGHPRPVAHEAAHPLAA
jgi:hypothetical protein